jgi:hypothetical protein
MIYWRVPTAIPKETHMRTISDGEGAHTVIAAPTYLDSSSLITSSVVRAGQISDMIPTQLATSFPTIYINEEYHIYVVA